MYRPGGFPEYIPSQQAKFDQIVDIVKSVFQRHNFEHIWTPAVEPVDILKKGGDIIDKQVYGLYGLAQGVEDVKDFALHFDLTIPLARYVLDNRNDLNFPFRRYQIQPVWRGERTKRGRYKEFWQFDADVIRPSEANIGTWYDIETVYVIDQAIKEILSKTGVKLHYKLHISDVVITKNRLISKSIPEDNISQVMKLLDDYYKLERGVWEDKLSNLMDKDSLKELYEIVDTQDINHPSLQGISGYESFREIVDGLGKLGVNYVYDICIVRGHDYYKGMVCERFDEDDISLGSLAGGGRYDNLTDFIDKKQSFSGVGASLGRIIPLVIEKMQDIKSEDKYLFINFAETQDEIVKLYNKYISQGKICELYPTPTKLGKQFEYADKKGIKYCVILGSGELEKGIYKIKDLENGEEQEFVLSRSSYISLTDSKLAKILRDIKENHTQDHRLGLYEVNQIDTEPSFDTPDDDYKKLREFIKDIKVSMLADIELSKKYSPLIFHENKYKSLEIGYQYLEDIENKL